MPLSDEASPQISTGVLIPINLVHQTIVYLESYNDLMAVMLTQHYKSWLEMSIQQLNQEKVRRVVATQVNGVDNSSKRNR